MHHKIKLNNTQMKAIKKIPLVSLLALVVFCGTQTIKAKIAHAPLGLIQFTYVEENEDDPFVFIPFDGSARGIPFYAVIYDDRTMVITFLYPVGSADAIICDGNFVVSTFHKPAGSQSMKLKLPTKPGNYTIYLRLQNGMIYQGEYTVD